VRRPKPHQVVLVVGVLVALGTIVSGILPRLTEWEDDSPVSRRTFVDVPDPIYYLFYATVAVMLVLCAALIATRVRNYERGAPDDRRTTKKNVHRRLRDFRRHRGKPRLCRIRALRAAGQGRRDEPSGGEMGECTESRSGRFAVWTSHT